MSPNELERTVHGLLAQSMSDEALRSSLEKLAQEEISFSGLTWLWGPELYQRNRVFFRPFILYRFSTVLRLPKWRWKEVRWKGDKAARLDQWLAATDRQDDVDLFKRLYEWRLSTAYNWKLRDQRSNEIYKALMGRLRDASSPAKRQIVLRKFDLWFELDEATAATLYGVDPKVTGAFILRHIKTNWWSGDTKRRLWSQLLKLADEQKDEEFRWKLYRRQVPLANWAEECLSLCDKVQDSDALVRELEKRHPEGFSLNLAEAFLKLTQKRGRDVFPYVMRHLRQVWAGWFMRGKYGEMADYAKDRGWWDLWSALIRTCAGPKEFNNEISTLLENRGLPTDEIVKRLLTLGGVSREWNWGSFGLASVHQLEESVALLFYERFPDLLRGPFKLHVQASAWGKTYPKFLEAMIAAKDEEMVDFLASRVVTRIGSWGNTKKMVEDADLLATYYSELKSNDAAFSRRAASVLSQIPAFSIWNYNVLIKENRLARLLFERSAAAYLAEPKSVADLVEGAEIHVMALAYRTLGLNDDRARAMALQHLPLLLGTLLRPLHRETRALAFTAIANAATTLEAARLIIERARDAMYLPETHYPKEKLLGLIASVLHRWPELRTASEQPVVYETVVAA